MGKTEQRKDNRQSTQVEFTYRRTGNLGDLSVYAFSRVDAKRVLEEEHGYTNVDVERIVRTGKTLAEYLADAGKEKGPIDGK